MTHTWFEQFSFCINDFKTQPPDVSLYESFHSKHRRQRLNGVADQFMAVERRTIRGVIDKYIREAPKLSRAEPTNEHVYQLTLLNV